jgi:cysteine desulfuration protein SufE
MSPHEKERQLIAKLSVIEDPQERLSWLVDRARKLPPLDESEKTEANRVQGCVSRVWIVNRVEDGICHYRIDADSTLVKGLAWVLCELCNDSPAPEVANFEPSVLQALHLSDHLSPTRRNGLENVQRTLREFAANAAGR